MNKNSKVLALKYRPQKFDDLIGQNIVAETITNSIKANKIPNAYLFTGIRGVGKTTIARIVAKSLNCLNGIDNICKDNDCESCDSIANSRHIDVLEQDAASKTSVDDVRDEIEIELKEFMPEEIYKSYSKKLEDFEEESFQSDWNILDGNNSNAYDEMDW